jgi:small subunit ribosomal protein S14
MAKKSMIQREKKRKQLILKYMKKRQTIKSEFKQAILYKEKINFLNRWSLIPRNASPSRLRRRCWVTGRSRGFYRDFGITRHVLREFAHSGMLPGLTKSSW